MPALYTHYDFGQKVLNKLSKKQQKEIIENIDYYNMFNQGFDNLYYHFKWNYYRELGNKAHKKNIDIFFNSLIAYIKNNNLQNDSQLTNMIYGFINHYTLDTLLHPFINYQVKKLGIPHTKIEFIIDSHIVANTNGKFYKTLIPKIKFKKELINLLNYVFENVHNEKNIGKIFNQSHNNGYYLYRYFIYDKYGIKTFIYKIIDFLLPFKKFKLSQNTFYTPKFDERLINSENQIWYHPNSSKETYNYSFNELINIALKISIKLNKDAYKVIHNKKDKEELINNIKLINLQNIQALLKK